MPADHVSSRQYTSEWSTWRAALGSTLPTGQRSSWITVSDEPASLNDIDRKLPQPDEHPREALEVGRLQRRGHRQRLGRIPAGHGVVDRRRGVVVHRVVDRLDRVRPAGRREPVGLGDRRRDRRRPSTRRRARPGRAGRRRASSHGKRRAGRRAPSRSFVLSAFDSCANPEVSRTRSSPSRMASSLNMLIAVFFDLEVLRSRRRQLRGAGRDSALGARQLRGEPVVDVARQQHRGVVGGDRARAGPGGSRSRADHDSKSAKRAPRVRLDQLRTAAAARSRRGRCRAPVRRRRGS